MNGGIASTARKVAESLVTLAKPKHGISCYERSMWANTIWGLVGLSTTCLFGMLNLPPEYVWLRPWCMNGAIASLLASIGLLCWPLRRPETRANVIAYCRHPMILAKKLEPIHIIILGVAISAGGIGWLLIRGAPVQANSQPTAEQIVAATASIRAELENTKLQLTALTPKPAIPPAPLRYTAYEKEQRLRAVDEIYSVIATKLSPAYVEGKTIFEQVRNGAMDDATQTTLVDHSKNVKIAFDEFAATLKRYEYFRDIVEVATQNHFNGLLEINASQNLSKEIWFWKSNLAAHAPVRDVWNRDMILFEASNASREFDKFLTETPPRLQQKRAEIEAAELVK